jgi:hypothetical protein
MKEVRWKVASQLEIIDWKCSVVLCEFSSSMTGVLIATSSFPTCGVSCRQRANYVSRRTVCEGIFPDNDSLLVCLAARRSHHFPSFLHALDGSQGFWRQNCLHGCLQWLFWVSIHLNKKVWGNIYWFRAIAGHESYCLSGTHFEISRLANGQYRGENGYMVGIMGPNHLDIWYIDFGELPKCERSAGDTVFD